MEREVEYVCRIKHKSCELDLNLLKFEILKNQSSKDLDALSSTPESSWDKVPIEVGEEVSFEVVEHPSWVLLV